MSIPLFAAEAGLEFDPGFAEGRLCVLGTPFRRDGGAAVAGRVTLVCGKCRGPVAGGGAEGPAECPTCGGEVPAVEAGPDDPTLYRFDSLVVSTGFNLNGHFFPSEDLWAARATLAHKPTNLEHVKDDILGHAVRAWPVDAELKPLSTAGAAPPAFHLMDSTVVYLVRPGPRGEALAQTLEDLERGLYWVSMETLFRTFDYAVGHSPSGKFVDVVHPQLVARTAETAHLSRYLRTVKRADGSRGPGRLPDGRLIGQALRGLTFSGKGLVKTPANPVSAVYAPDGRLLSGVLPAAEGAAALPVYTPADPHTGSDMTIEQLTAELAVAKASLEAATKAKDEMEAAHAKALADAQAATDAVKADAAVLQAALTAAQTELRAAAEAKRDAERTHKVAAAFKMDEAKAAELVAGLKALSDEAFAGHIEAVTKLTTPAPAAPAPEPKPALPTQASILPDEPKPTDPAPTPAPKPDLSAAARAATLKYSKGSK